MKKSTLMWLALFLFVAVLFAPAMVVASNDDPSAIGNAYPAGEEQKSCFTTNTGLLRSHYR